MSGVEILNKTEIVYHTSNIPLSAIIGLMVFIFVSLFLCRFLDLNIYDNESITVGMIGFLVGLFAFIICANVSSSDVHTGKYQYQVTISDEVNFNDFINKYNVIKTEGKIYTVEEK